MYKYPVAVIIPIYKEDLSFFETLSLKQCFKLLSKHPIVFIAPSNINLDVYFNVCDKNSCRVVYFENKYFTSIQGYNRLMLSPHFYKTFFDYKFILLYQLDAFVFKDDLLYWCSKNFDFIGAPHRPFENKAGNIQFLNRYRKFWKKVGKIFKINHKVSNVGNGGFSLRKTRSAYWLTTLIIGRTKWALNEDAFFEYWGNLFYPFFRLAPDEVAIEFSIETFPKEFLEKLNYRLPFGCHAFEKYNWEVWKPFIYDK